jgi:phosphatidylglycerol:prolipoprotein diacylglycerol transferase
MYPLLYEFNGLVIYSYGLMITLGFLTMILVVVHEARRRGRPDRETALLLLASLTGAAVGSRLVWVLTLGPSAELLNPYNGFIPGGAGFHYMGVLIGGYLGGLVAKRALEVKDMLGDPFALGLLAMMVLVRIGCFLGGCCYGKPSHLPWAVYLHGAYRHPTQLYEALFQAAALAVLWRWRDRMPRPGDLLKAYYFAYALFRFGQQFLRDDHPVAALGLSVPHFLALGILAWLVITLWSRLRQRSDQAASMPAAQVS